MVRYSIPFSDDAVLDKRTAPFSEEDRNDTPSDNVHATWTKPSLTGISHLR